MSHGGTGEGESSGAMKDVKEGKITKVGETRRRDFEIP